MLTKRAKTLIATIFIIIVLGLLSWFIYYQFFTLRISSAKPTADKVSVSTPIITLTSNKDLSNENISFDDGGSGIVASVNVNGKTLIINLYQNMSSGTDYSIKIKDIGSKDGNYKIDEYTYSFKPVNDDSLLTPDDVRIILERQDQKKPSLMSDPVYVATPFYTSSYVVKSILSATPDGEGRVIIQATIYLTRQEASNSAAVVNKYKTDILNRLKAIDGFSEDKYQIEYKVQS